MNELKEKMMWLVLKYGDGTCRTLHTTLNRELLDKVGAISKEGTLYDFEHGDYVQIDSDVVNVELSEDKPVFKEELLNYASRFI